MTKMTPLKKGRAALINKPDQRGVALMRTQKRARPREGVGIFGE
jgi:hypothetical protein